jgi:hypothetical protein
MCFRNPELKKALLAIKEKGCPKCGTINTVARIFSGKGCIKCGASLYPDAARPQETPARPPAPPKVPPPKAPPGSEAEPEKKQEEE